MATYRELFFNNIENFLATGFPVLKAILAGEPWLDLVQDFFARHRSRTRLFVQVAEEFLDYLQNERGERSGDPGFLLELAHYEWVELALSVAEAEPPAAPELTPETAPLDQILVPSALAWPLAYRYPVHLIGPDHQPAQPPLAPTFLLVYRDRDDTMRFMEINPATFRWLQILGEEGPVGARESLLRVAAELGQSDPTAVLKFGEDLILDLAARAVVGVVRPVA
jgi:hypothetical protein